jgi:hypothetical protein
MFPKDPPPQPYPPYKDHKSLLHFLEDYDRTVRGLDLAGAFELDSKVSAADTTSNIPVEL